MPAAADERDAIPQFQRFAVPVMHRLVRPLDPGAIGGVQMDRRIAERAAPLDLRRVEVRMRDRDRLDAAETPDEGDRRRIERRDAIPQHVAALRAHQKRALADGEMRFAGKAENVRGMLDERIAVRFLQRLERRPGLPARRNVLPLLFADVALRRRGYSFRILHAASGADEERHGVTLFAVIPGCERNERTWNS